MPACITCQGKGRMPPGPCSICLGKGIKLCSKCRENYELKEFYFIPHKVCKEVCIECATKNEICLICEGQKIITEKGICKYCMGSGSGY